MSSNADAQYLDFLSEYNKQCYFEAPRLSSEEKQIYFDLSNTETTYYKNLASDSSRLSYIILSGYFKATHRFFTISKILVPSEDIVFIQKRFHIKGKQHKISKTTASKHIKSICDAFNIQCYSKNTHRVLIAEKAADLTKLHIKPIFIFTELLRNLQQFGISLPSYREFQRIISTAIRQEEKRLCQMLLSLPNGIVQRIQVILDKHGEFHMLVIFYQDYLFHQSRLDITVHLSNIMVEQSYIV